MNSFFTERDEAITMAVTLDDWDGVLTFCEHWGITIPESEIIMKAGIYKATQECPNIPENVKTIASEKCVALGFKPFIRLRS